MFRYLSSESENSYVYVSVYLWDVSLCFNIHLKKIKGHLSENLGNGKTVEVSNTI